MAIRVQGPGSSNQIQRKKTEKPKKASKPGQFAAHLRRLDGASETETGAKEQISSTTGIGGILAAQAIDPATGEIPSYEERKSRARRGLEILGRLEQIRNGLLLGSIPKDHLALLARLVRQKRERGTDPLISQLLDEIELRAEVELAKLSQRKKA
ncbi:MAG: flagellar assembly protein FliX [Rhodospirillaceae bacterium]